MSHGERGCVLALDIGTSSARASLYDLRGRPVPDRFAHITYSPRVTADGGAEFDPCWLVDQVCTTVDRVLATPPPGPIVAVAVGSFWHSLMGLDAAGQPLTPVYLWLDGRSRSVLPELRQRLDTRAIHARTGCVLHWSYWPAKLTWLRRGDPETFTHVKRWVGFGEFVLRTLTGTDAMSVSMASGTGLLDVHSCAWDNPVPDTVGVRLEALPRLVDVDEPDIVASAAWQARWPALAGVPWLPPVGDGASSNLGAGCTTERDVAIMIGTSGAERVLRVADQPFTIPWGIWCYRLDRRHIVLGGAMNDGGALIDWLDESLRLGRRHERDGAIAVMPPDSHGLTVLPLWGGERSPNWSDDARGGIVGLRLKTSPTDVLRASMEAVALRFAEIDRLLERVANSAPGEVVGTGSALLHSPAWLQILADALQRPVLASAESEATSRGVSLLALRRLGILGEPLSTIRPRVRRRYAPRPEFAETYRKAGERQRRLYDALVS
ncbi:MAG: gluconokinase [Chloroflexota bacterium]